MHVAGMIPLNYYICNKTAHMDICEITIEQVKKPIKRENLLLLPAEFLPMLQWPIHFRVLPEHLSLRSQSESASTQIQ